jgi:ornithine carbamoyltransferase
MKGKDFLSISDINAEDIHSLISYAVESKDKEWTNLLDGKILAILFEKQSSRTRVSFEVAMRQLGGQTIYLSQSEVGIGKREPVKDIARVLGRYVEAVAARTFLHRTVEELAEYSGVPVINALSDLEHPCQALADLLTIYEKKNTLTGLNLAFIGDGNNVAHSLLLAAALTGMNISIASPTGYTVHEQYIRLSEEYAAVSGSRVLLTGQPEDAVKDADIVYTDVWASMGQEAEAEQRKRLFAGYQVNAKLMSLAKKDAIFMHDLPAHRGEEVTDDILEGPQSVAFDQAENRLHAQRALLVKMLGT